MRKRVNSESSFKSRKSYRLRSETNGKETRLSISTSTVSLPASHSGVGSGIKLSDSYYNDGRKLYLNRSRVLSERISRYQNKDISLTERKKYEGTKLESIIRKRETVQSEEINPQITRRSQVKKRIDNLNVHKYQRLVYGSKQSLVKKKLLERSITKNLQHQSKSQKWMSPYKDGGSHKIQYEGKPLIPKNIPQKLSNTDNSQLKVLNLDRLFRKKDGVLTNIVPLPTTKLQAITSRKNVLRTVKKKDKIHNVIEEYNRLVRIMTLRKTAPKIAIRGKNFTLNPTLEELMGIKPRPQSKLQFGQSQQISEQVFTEYCTFFRNTVKQDPHLNKRLIAGFKKNGRLDLIALTRFYSIFINQVAQSEEKIDFLCYFFIPQGQQRIELAVLKLILEIMCQRLPTIDNLNVRTDLLTQSQKSKIFLQALHRVLFGQLKQLEVDYTMNRQMIRMIFERNCDAVDLLIKLLHSE